MPLGRTSLPGKLVCLEPLSRELHMEELVAIADDPEIWRFLSSKVKTGDEMRAYVETLLQGYESGSVLPFAVRGQKSGRLIGMTRLKDLSPEHRKAMVGTWFVRSEWGTGCNAEAKLLLLRYGFETMQCVRIEFQTDSRNERSRAALARMGAVEEGTLRSYFISNDGYRRDSVIFSVLDREWPEVKRKLETRLAAQTAG